MHSKRAATITAAINFRRNPLRRWLPNVIAQIELLYSTRKARYSSCGNASVAVVDCLGITIS